LSIPLWGHAAALALGLADAALRGWRLQLLVPGAERPSLGASIRTNAYGDAVSVVTPARLGGDPARFLGLRRSGVGSVTAVIALATEQLIDWVLVGAFAVALGTMFGEEGARGVRALAARLADPRFLPWVGASALLLIAGAVAARWYARRHPGVVAGGVRRALDGARSLGPATLASATAITALSMALRITVLPVLALAMLGGAACTSGCLAPSLGSLLLGSFGLVHGQLLLPVPAGAGSVDVAFAAGFAGSFGPAQIAELLVAWRVWTTGFDLAFGALLALGAAWTKRSAGRESPVGDAR
jgi:uncharacterized membrane protein YbhN (UPF0104 family)